MRILKKYRDAVLSYRPTFESIDSKLKWMQNGIKATSCDDRPLSNNPSKKNKSVFCLFGHWLVIRFKVHGMLESIYEKKTMTNERPVLMCKHCKRVWGIE
jgi:hypothetical protein